MLTPVDQTIRYQDAQQQDLARISLLAREIWPTAYGNILSPDQLDYMLDQLYSLPSLEHQQQEGHCFILVLRGSEAIGFADYSPKQPPLLYHLNKIYLLAGCQGSGLGGSLLREIIRRVRELGATGLELNVNRHNPARYFYEKAGFRIRESADIPIGHGYFMNDFIMRLDL